MSVIASLATTVYILLGDTGDADLRVPVAYRMLVGTYPPYSSDQEDRMNSAANPVATPAEASR